MSDTPEIIVSAIAFISSKAIDPHSPYHLHASDSLGHIYVGDLLSESNYGEWVHDMRNALFAKNKFCFVDGSLPMPSSDSSDLNQWMCCNAIIKGWLKSVMNKDLRSSIRYANTVYKIWIDLRECFGQGSSPRANELQRAISHIWQEKQSVLMYFNKLKVYWDEHNSLAPLPKCSCTACTCDVAKEFLALREKDHLYDFLIGLDDAYE